MADDIQDRAVAGTFLFRFPNDDVTQPPKIALFRRSDKVSTYPNKYSLVSGSIESSDPSPLAAALRELHEETALAPPSVRLFRTGKPYSFVDPSVRRHWTINPFAFLLTSAAGPIAIDWEHDSYTWFQPQDVVDNEDVFVPRLRESLRRVWFDFDLGPDAAAALTRGLKALQDDHESGARQLASKAVRVFIDVIARLDQSSQQTWWFNVRLAAWHLWKNGREAMGASILSAMLTSLSIIEARLPPATSDALPQGFSDDVLAGIKHFSEERHDVSSRVASSFAAFIRDTFPNQTTLKILTLSYSSTISASLQNLAQQPSTLTLDIRVLESRPLFEGVALARTIADTIALNTPHSPSRVTVYTDACAAVAASDVDMVLIGADLLDRDGRVSNKTGSLPAVLAARHVSPRARIVALADRDKVLPFDPPLHAEENDPRELVEAWGRPRNSPGRVAVRNVYFEWVPENLVDSYVTEEGVMSTEGIQQWADHLRKRADGFFTDL
ncbi:hypothetical protein B0I35DRAFT_349729 [Stachybotrys elegans]|uniref:Nudix hydrolase domain-containing protein n=1 Tax=Stachybotrys elegans TaxID=80388 RepID=A0A8K0T0K7_9HYPO|nr:hypothetical protein B0I35DRAFT_349729 [Stachybotrys elegans]